MTYSVLAGSYSDLRTKNMRLVHQAPNYEGIAEKGQEIVALEADQQVIQIRNDISGIVGRQYNALSQQWVSYEGSYTTGIKSPDLKPLIEAGFELETFVFTDGSILDNRNFMNGGAVARMEILFKDMKTVYPAVYVETRGVSSLVGTNQLMEVCGWLLALECLETQPARYLTQILTDSEWLQRCLTGENRVDKYKEIYNAPAAKIPPKSMVRWMKAHTAPVPRPERNNLTEFENWYFVQRNALVDVQAGNLARQAANAHQTMEMMLNRYPFIRGKYNEIKSKSKAVVPKYQ